MPTCFYELFIKDFLNNYEYLYLLKSIIVGRELIVVVSVLDLLEWSEKWGIVMKKYSD